MKVSLMIIFFAVAVAVAQGTVDNVTFSGVWSTGPSLPEPRFYQAQAVIGSKIYAIAGQKMGGYLSSNVVIDTVKLNPGGGVWSSAGLPSLPSTREGHGVAAVGTKLYSIGGTNTHTPIDQGNVLMLDTAGGGGWTVGPSLSRKRFFIAVAAVNLRLYAIGGTTDQRSADTTVEMLDTSAATPAWTAAPGLSGARIMHAVAACGTKLYVSGGMTPGIVNSVEVFDTATPGGVWQPGPSLNVARKSHGMAAVGTRVLWWAVAQQGVCFPAWRSWTRPRRRGGSRARTQAIYSRSHSRL